LETCKVNNQDRRAVATLGRDLVQQVVPGELPLFASVSRAYFAGSLPKREARGRDDLLGFGVGEAVVLVAPIVLRFAEEIWETVSQQAATAAGGVVAEVFRRLRLRCGGNGSKVRPSTPALSVEELQYVRTVGRRCAENLPLTSQQRHLLVESLVGNLAAPDTPESVTT